MRSKIKLAIITMLIISIAVAFSGCSLSDFGSSKEGSDSGVPTIDGGIVVYPNGDRVGGSKFDDDEDIIDTTSYYDSLLGVKVAYDGSANSLELMQDAKFEAVYSRVSEYLETNATIDFAKFIESNTELGVDETYISRVVWLYNYANQYRTLAHLILTDLVKNYGLGIENDYVLNNNLYGSIKYSAFTITDNGDYKSHKNAINANVTATTNEIYVENPYYLLGTAVYKYQDGTEIDFNTMTTIDFELTTLVPSEVYSFLCNLNNSNPTFTFTIDNPYYDPNNIVNQKKIDDGSDTGTKIDNPEYIPNHIFSMKEISFVGNVQMDGSVKYTIGTSEITTMSTSEFLNQYLQNYSNYLALKLLEAHTFAETTYSESPELVDDNAFLTHYENWLNYQGKLGFEENFYDAKNAEYNTVEKFAEVVEKYIVGTSIIEKDENAGEYSKDIKNTVKQSVLDSINAKISKNTDNFVLDADNGTIYFQEVHCIEYKDYSAKELFNIKDDQAQASNISARNISANSVGDCDIQLDIGDDESLVLPEENYYSVVVMLKQGTSASTMQELLTLFWAKNNDINISMGYRYVLEGKNKIFADVDYSITPTSSESEDSVINEFTGKVEKYTEQEFTTDFANKNSFSLEDYNTPQINTLKNKEVTLSKFTNNFVAINAIMQNISSIAYAFDSQLNYYYYTESSTDCDYVEALFRASLPDTASEADTLTYSLAFLDIVLESTTDETAE